jgi:spore germination protein YaaH
MHDLLLQRSRPNVRTSGLVAAVIAVALLVLSPLAPAPLAAPIARAADPGVQARVSGIAPLERQVYGYLPYWRLDSGTVDRLDYDLISTIAMFGLGIKKDGNIDTAWRGYTAYVSDNATAVTNAAHAKGVRVVPTFQLFDSGTLPKMSAFLHSKAAQSRFIKQAIALMGRRSADGANFDFEPMPQSLSLDYAKFLAKFKTSMLKSFPKAKLVAATSAGAPYTLIDGIENIVDQMLVMTYNYRWSGSTVTGAIAPLDNTTRTVKLHIERYLKHVPASKLILGVPYYGYDWPVTSQTPNATVNKPTSKWGGVWSVSYTSARKFLEVHPEVVRHEDTAEGSAYFTYWDPASLTFRQVYFEDELSVAAKYDYAIANGLAGVGIWTLDNDRGYTDMYDVLRAKFYDPNHRTTVGSRTTKLTRSSGAVKLTHVDRVKNTGNVPERGTLVWRIYGPTGKLVKKGSLTFTVYPGKTRTLTTTTVLGTAAGLSAGTYKLRVQFTSHAGVWKAPVDAFRQPY